MEARTPLLNADWFRTDVKQALRALRRRPGSSALAILTLSVGLGVNTVAFSAVNALVFRPLGRPDADRAGWVFAGPRSRPLQNVPLPLFEAIERDARSFEAVAAEGRMPLALGGGAEARQVWTLLVSSRYFDVVVPDIALGRALSAADARADDVAVVVSEHAWRAHLGANPSLPALTVTLGGKQARVVGVMRDGFQGPGGLFEPDFWVPLAARRAVGLPEDYDAVSNAWLTMVARPREGVSTAALAIDVLPIVREFRGAEPASAQVRFERLIDGHPEARSLRPVAALALGAVSVVLLIACFNVAGLLLARSSDRQGEIGVRAAMGASRGRLIRQLLTEGMVLATVAFAFALLLATWSASLLSTFSLPAPIPQRLHFSMDWRLVTFAAAAALVAALVPAIAPAWQLWKTDVARLVRGSASGSVGGRPQARARRAFLLVQVTGSTLFLIAAVLFARSFLSAQSAETGFNTENTAVMIVDARHYGYDAARARELIEALTRRLELRPDVAAVGFADRAPFYVGFANNMSIVREGQACEPPACPVAEVFAVDPRYFAAMDVPVRMGRLFDPRDHTDRDAVVVTASTAAALWPGAHPVGQRFKDAEAGIERVVAGVVADVSLRTLTAATPRPTLFRAVSDADFAGPVTLVARGRGPANGLLPAMRQGLHELAPGVPPHTVETMEQRLALPLWPVRTLAGFFGLCGLLAVGLASVGLFGVTHHVVSQRTREFGVRLALGASRVDLRRLVLTEALRLVGPGIVLGGVAGFALSLLVGSRLVGVEAPGPAIFVGSLALQVLVVIAASFLPAQKASRVDPLVALRAE